MEAELHKLKVKFVCVVHETEYGKSKLYKLK